MGGLEKLEWVEKNGRNGWERMKSPWNLNAIIESIPVFCIITKGGEAGLWEN
jgi:hypothetical protein